jgi:hypothetical protein
MNLSESKTVLSIDKGGFETETNYKMSVQVWH